MSYSLSRTPAIDSVLLSSCQSLAPTLVASGNNGAYHFVNEQSDYWNIDDILAEEELVPTTFKSDAHNLGYLDQMAHNAQLNKTKVSTEDKSATLKKGSKVDIPLWLAIALAQRDIVGLRNPLYLSEKYLNLLEADSDVVNLRTQSPHIYENILKLCAHLSSEHVYKYIAGYQRVFIDRFCKHVIEMADTSEILQNQEQFSTDLKRMSDLEREVFEMHKRQRLMFSMHRNKTQNRQVTVNYDIMDPDLKQANKRMRV